MRKQLVGGAETELGRQRCRCCRRRVRPGERVLVEHLTGGHHSLRFLVWHPDCIADVCEDTPMGDIPGPRAEDRIRAAYGQLGELIASTS